MCGLRILCSCFCLCGVALAGPVCATDPPDLGKIDRRLVREPAYLCKQPLYGLYVFGPQAQTRVWAVFDKSKPDLAHYDILYFDRNADGDLTGADERIMGQGEPGQMRFNIGSFTDPATKQQHTDLVITRREGHGAGVMFEMKWSGKVVVRGGYAPRAGPYTQFAATPAQAPVLWPGADGAFRFQFWELQPLRIGDTDDVRVFLGHSGQGPNTFCAVPDTFLPRAVPVIATLNYTDKDGKERQSRSELKERC
jgi:hypothetical protein